MKQLFGCLCCGNFWKGNPSVPADRRCPACHAYEDSSFEDRISELGKALMEQIATRKQKK